MKSKGFIISAVITSLFYLGSINTAYAQEKYKVNRLGGKDRIETSVKIAADYNNGQLQAVVVTTANDFPEALTVASSGIFPRKYPRGVKFGNLAIIKTR